jgi:hypothetical protein
MQVFQEIHIRRRRHRFDIRRLLFESRFAKRRGRAQTRGV